MRGSQLCEVVSRDQRWTHVPGMRIGGVRRNLSPTCASCLAPPLFQLLHLEIGVTRELVPDDILRIRPREIVEHEKRGALKTHNRRNRATSPGSYGMNAAGGAVLRAPSRRVRRPTLWAGFCVLRLFPHRNRTIHRAPRGTIAVGGAQKAP